MARFLAASWLDGKLYAMQRSPLGVSTVESNFYELQKQRTSRRGWPKRNERLERLVRQCTTMARGRSALLVVHVMVVEVVEVE